MCAGAEAKSEYTLSALEPTKAWIIPIFSEVPAVLR